MNLNIRRDINEAYHQELNYGYVDGLLIKILWGHFVILFLGVLAIYFLQPADVYPSPFSWRNLTQNEVGSVLLISFLTSLIPSLARGRMQNHYSYRLLMLFAYTVYSFLLIIASGGAIEMHFYLYGIWALLTLYYDWRLIAIGFVSVLFLHIAFELTAPELIYSYGENHFSFISHGLFSLLTAIFTINIAKNGRKMVVDIHKANLFIQTKLS